MIAQRLQMLESRCQHRLAGTAIRPDVQRRQVAEVSVIFPGEAMAPGLVRVPVTACGSGWCPLAVRLHRVAAGLGMHMETMDARLQALEVRGEDQAVSGLADGHGTHRRTRSLLGRLLHGHGDGLAGLYGGGTEQCEGQGNQRFHEGSSSLSINGLHRDLPR